MTENHNWIWRTLRGVLFGVDAENVHRFAKENLKIMSRILGAPMAPSHWSRHPALKRNLWSVEFPNPLGLAAGFDQNAECLMAWQLLGFGYVEVGGVTALAQGGNPKPRLFRLPEDLAFLNRMGFDNLGAEHVARNLERQRKDSRLQIPIGVNIAKSKIVPLEEAAADYIVSFRLLADFVDYIAINVSSPNTPGLRTLQAPEAFSRLLEAICSENQRRRVPKPLLVKLAPDLHIDDALACAKLAHEFSLAGLVVSNTTLDRDNLKSKYPEGPGGISGLPLFAKSTHMLEQLSKEYAGKLSFIGVGGIMDAAGAKAKFDAGADLIQSYTGFVYGGPFFAKEILQVLVDNYEH